MKNEKENAKTSNFLGGGGYANLKNKLIFIFLVLFVIGCIIAGIVLLTNNIVLVDNTSTLENEETDPSSSTPLSDTQTSSNTTNSLDPPKLNFYYEISNCITFDFAGNDVYNESDFEPIDLAPWLNSSYGGYSTEYLIRPLVPGKYFNGFYHDSAYTNPVAWSGVITTPCTLYAQFLDATVDFGWYDSNLGVYVYSIYSTIYPLNPETIIFADCFEDDFGCHIVEGIIYESSPAYTEVGAIPSTVKEIYMPYCVKYIGDSFAQNATSLEKVHTMILYSDKYTPSSVFGITGSIGDYAFYNCTNLIFFETEICCEYIGNYAFENCSLLNLYMNKVNNFGYCAFNGCSSLTYNIFNVASQYPEELFNVQDYAFAYTGLSGSITLYDNVGGMSCAFEGCDITEVILSDNLDDEWINIYIPLFFPYCPISNVVNNTGKSYWSFQNNCLVNTNDKTIVFGCNIETESTWYIGSGCYNYIIKENAFFGKDKITDISFDSSLAEICSLAFINCHNLTSVYIPWTSWYCGQYDTVTGYPCTGSYYYHDVLYSDYSFDSYVISGREAYTDSFGNYYPAFAGIGSYMSDTNPCPNGPHW